MIIVFIAIYYNKAVNRSFDYVALYHRTNVSNCRRGRGILTPLSNSGVLLVI